MATYKRQLWTSGYTYRSRCPACGTVTEYTDRQLGFRSWYPNGFIYCNKCRKPLRHNEMYAVKPDGTPVYSSQAEADLTVREGYYNAVGFPAGPGVASPGAPAPCAPPAQPDGAQGSPDTSGDVAACSECGRTYKKGTDHFCPNCGKKLD